MLLIIFFVDRRDDKVIINSHTQSRGTGVRSPIMTFSITISTFLYVELGFRAHVNVIDISRTIWNIFLKKKNTIWNFY